MSRVFRVTLASCFLSVLAGHTCAQEAQLERVLQRGHSSNHVSIALNRDGRYFLTGSMDNTAILWDGNTGRVLRRFEEHKSKVTSVSLSRDAHRALTCAEDVILWDTLTGRKVRTFERYFKGALSADGHTVLVVTGLSNVSLFQVDAVEPIRSLDATDGKKSADRSVHAVGLSEDGRRILTVMGREDSGAVVWDAQTGAKIRGFYDPELWRAHMSNDGRRLATQLGNRTLVTWNIDAGTKLHTFSFPEEIKQFALSPDGNELLVGLEKGIGIYDAATGKELRSLSKVEWASLGAWSGDGKRILSSTHRKATAWNADTAEALHSFEYASEGVFHVDISADGRYIASSYYSSGGADVGRKPALWSGVTGQRDFLTGQIVGSTILVRLSADGKYFLRDSRQYKDFDIYLVETATGRVVHTLKGHGRGIQSLAMTPDARYALSGSTEANGILWDLQTGQKIRDLPGNRSYVVSVALTPDGAVAGGISDEKAVVWNARTGQKIAGTDTEKYTRLALSRDGKQALLAGYNYRTAALDVATSKRTIIDDFEPISNVVLFSHGKSGLLATDQSFDIWHWDIGSNKIVRKLKGHTSHINSLAISGDDRLLVSGSSDATVRLWDLHTGRELCALLTLNQDKDWMVVTPEGYFDGSSNASRYLGFRVAGTLDFLPFEQFQRRYFKPGLLAEILGGKRPEPAVPITKAVPPRVRIVEPAKSGTVDQSRLQISAIAEGAGSQPVTSLRLLVDDRPYGGQKGVHRVVDPKPGETRVSWNIELTPGPHTIKVLADTELVQGHSEEVSVKLVQPEADVLLPNLYVVAVGVSKYPGDLKLNYAAKDAEELGKAYALHAKPLFRKIEVKVITDDQATRTGILRGLTWLQANMTQRDFGVFFFAGHGEKGNTDDLYFLPVDVEVGALAATAVSADDLKRLLNGIPGRLIAILDACHSGGIDARKRSVRGLTDDLLRDLVATESGLVVFCSATGREFALEDNAIQHGIFTFALLEGLAGKGFTGSTGEKMQADYNGDGVIHLIELENYVLERVKHLSQGRQHPVTGRPSTIRSFPVSKPK